MKRTITTVMITAIFLCGVALVALKSKPVAAADDSIRQYDQAVTADLDKGDQEAAEKYLDADFSWIDSKGVMRVKEDAFRVGLKPLVSAGPDVKYVEHDYGNVVWLQANRGNNWVAHFWVKRPAGWKLLHTTEITARPKDYTTVRPNFDVPCINPCKEVPYTPVTENEKAALAGWQDQESGEAGWDKHVADNLGQRAATTWGGPRPEKKDMIAARNKRMAENPNEPKVAAVPALFIRSWDFGTAVVMIACQPTYGDRAYWSSRVFAPLNGTWMMMDSYHNYIASSPVMTAVPVTQSKDAIAMAAAQ